MASGMGKLQKTKRSETKKSHSWWWDSHISPRNSKWLQENLEEMDELVRKMLKLIEEDADSFAKKAELYFKKRPELVTLVEEFYRMYRSLAEKYDNVTGELRKSIPSDLQSQGSGISDVGSEPSVAASASSDHSKPARTKSGPRAAGFDIFLDLNRKVGDDISTPDSESQSDDSSFSDYSGSQRNEEDHGLRKRVLELENELQEMKEKLELQKAADLKEFYHESSELGKELEVARKKIRSSDDEIVRLTDELQRYKSCVDSESIEKQQNSSDILASITTLEHSDLKELKDQNFEEELRMLQGKLHDSEHEVESLRSELTSMATDNENRKKQLISAQNECSTLNNKIARDERETARLKERMLRYKSNLSERDQEIRALKEALSNANKSLYEENERLRAEMDKVIKEKTFLEDRLKESEFRLQTLDEDLRRTNASSAEMEASLRAQIEQLKADIAAKDDSIAEMKMQNDKLVSGIIVKTVEIDEMNKHLHQLHLQHVELISKVEEARKVADGLQARMKELQEEVELKQETLIERDEEKREAIRQLCVSIEHYRSGYHQLRQSIIVHKQPAALAR